MRAANLWSNIIVRLLVLLLLSTALVPPLGAETVVNDVTKLNPVVVERVVTPYTIDEVQDLVRAHHGPISIGGGHFSMGGQTASEQTLHLDMRKLDRIVAFSPNTKTITVEAGITWRAIQEAIDHENLSLRIMQSYANFTVGGSLSVNVHGRYVGQGPLIGSIRSIKVVLANGDLIEASPKVNPDVFYGCIGGYGGLGIIVEATLELADNRPVKRSVERMPVTAYKDFFFRTIRPSSTAVFHNADLYPPHYDEVAAITWNTTDEPVTIADRLRPSGHASWMDQMGYWWLSEVPGAQAMRRLVADPLRFIRQPVVWRNYEASYNVAELEPRSRESSTYVLQEYFVPVGRFDEFVTQMAEVFTRSHANIVNVSIRHAVQDPGALLAWAREEVFAFVIYYKQGTSEEDKAGVGMWTRALIDAVLSVNGTYYLPYQLHATDEQFHRAYPRATDYFALKAHLDPMNRFRNKLLDRYYRPSTTSPIVTVNYVLSTEKTVPATLDLASLHARPGYRRPFGQTFLTLPEWYIVYSADEFAAFVKTHSPNSFPYFRSIGQFWRLYSHVAQQDRNGEPFNWGAHLMLSVIGTSFTAEYALKGAYESTVGALTTWVSSEGSWNAPTPEDRFIEEVAQQYATFIHEIPWYDFRFAPKLIDLWTLHGSSEEVLRRAERKMEYSVELLGKAAWAQVIQWGTHAAYDPEAATIQMIVKISRQELSSLDEGITVLEALDEKTMLLGVPRYELFKRAVEAIIAHHGEILEVAGNEEILMTMIVPQAWYDAHHSGKMLWEWPLLSDPERKRVALLTPIPRLHYTIPMLKHEGIVIDHLYDF
ncbi:MAG TPA: FAD-binding oxidoreductase [Nitrospiraceae bacterium]|nr:FAD-binding oxidoreductase [Nitrospiraceae bacterium]